MEETNINQVAEQPKTKEQLAAEAKANQEVKFQAIRDAFAKAGQLVDVKESVLRFKEVEVKDADNKSTGEKYKRPEIEIGLPVPSLEGLLAILAVPTIEVEIEVKDKAGNVTGKQIETRTNPEFALVFEALENMVSDQAREIVNDNEKITTADFPYEQLSWHYISTLPKSERRGGGIAKEIWEAFVADYIVVIQEFAGKTITQATNASKLLAGKFNACKGNKILISKLKSQLAIYLTNTKKAEEFSKCVEFLDKKADALLAVNEEEAANLI